MNIPDDPRTAPGQLRSLLHALDGLQVYVYTKDPEGRYTYVNQRVVELFGRPVEQILGQCDTEFWGESMLDNLLCADREVLEQGVSLEREDRFVLASREIRTFLSIKAPVLDPDGTIAGLSGISIDITELARAQRALGRSEAKFRTMFELGADAVLLLDGAGAVLDANQAAQRVFGWRPGAVDGVASWSAPHQPDHPGAVEAVLPRLLGRALQGETLTFDWLFTPLRGQPFDASVSLSAVSVNDRPACLMNVRDVSERKRQQQRIEQFAFTDALTGLANRRLLTDRLEQAWRQGRRNGGHHGLVFLDLDNFKPLNDRHGHAAGDRLLQQVAHRLHVQVRATDTVARQGGDEFVLLLADLGPDAAEAAAHAQQVAGKVLAALCQPYRIEPAAPPSGAGSVGRAPGTAIEHHGSASLGVTLLRPDDDSVDAAIRRADDAMYQAKADGRACVRYRP